MIIFRIKKQVMLMCTVNHVYCIVSAAPMQISFGSFQHYNLNILHNKTYVQASFYNNEKTSTSILIFRCISIFIIVLPGPRPNIFGQAPNLSDGRQILYLWKCKELNPPPPPVLRCFLCMHVE